VFELDYNANNAKGVGVLVGFACSGRLITPEMVAAMATQHPPTHMSDGYLVVKGLPVEKARELIAEKAVECGAKYLWFVDDDTIPPPNAMQKLIYFLDNYPEYKAVGGIYVTKADVSAPVCFRGEGKGSFWHWKKGDIFEVTGIGAGCLMIAVDVFKELPKPWFTFSTVYNDQISETTPALDAVSEDIHFCQLVRKAGYKIAGHGDVLCAHYDLHSNKFFYLPPDSYPMRNDSENKTNFTGPLKIGQ